jgi:hypothetical protein
MRRRGGSLENMLFDIVIDDLSVDCFGAVIGKDFRPGTASLSACQQFKKQEAESSAYGTGRLDLNSSDRFKRSKSLPLSGWIP